MSEPELTGYENEPEDIFLPLTPDLYASFFHLEMGDTDKDCFFYREILNNHDCHNVLELGCGTGRILRFLTASDFTAYGIDISPSMLQFASHLAPGTVAEMDMRMLGFKPDFDCVIIPHNTLNLLFSTSDITRCLQQAKDVLKPGGLLAAELFTTTAELSASAGGRIFQFALFDRPEGGKLVKETIKTFLPEKNLLLLEERYKVRPFSHPSLNKNFAHHLSLAAFSFDQWQDLLNHSGFTIISAYSDFTRRHYCNGKNSTLLVLAQST